jgi:hypothetical protein
LKMGEGSCRCASQRKSEMLWHFPSRLDRMLTAAQLFEDAAARGMTPMQ